MSTLQDKYVNPLTDFGFKKLFGSEPNKELLIDFLNQVLPEKHQIKDLTYARNEQLGLAELDRKAIFDLYCVSKTGERFIVELQKAKQNFFKDRSVYYASFPIQEQAKKGDWNYKLNAVYTVGILDFVFDDHKMEDKVVYHIELKDQDCEVFYDKLRFIYIQLPKFTKTEAELETHFDKWLYVFRHLADLQNRPRKLQERVFEKLFEVAEIAKFTRTEREAYEDSLKYYRDMKNVIDTSREEGQEEGFEEGFEEGLQQGLQQGAYQQKLDVARKMRAAGTPIAQIQDFTGLSIGEIEQL